jgi:hypothetical protein
MAGFVLSEEWHDKETIRRQYVRKVLYTRLLARKFFVM